jgi:hypothetical protein
VSITQEIRTAARHRKDTRHDLLRRIEAMEREANNLACALRKACDEIDTQTQALNAAVIVAVGRAEKILELEGNLKAQAGKVVRRDAEIARLAASLKNTQRALADAQPRLSVGPAPLVPPFAPRALRGQHPDDTQPIPLGRWLGFPAEPDDDTTVNIPLADLLAAGVTPRLSDRLDAEQTVTVGRDHSTA